MACGHPLPRIQSQRQMQDALRPIDRGHAQASGEIEAKANRPKTGSMGSAQSMNRFSAPVFSQFFVTGAPKRPYHLAIAVQRLPKTATQALRSLSYQLMSVPFVMPNPFARTSPVGQEVFRLGCCLPPFKAGCWGLIWMGRVLRTRMNGAAVTVRCDREQTALLQTALLHVDGTRGASVRTQIRTAQPGSIHSPRFRRDAAAWG